MGAIQNSLYFILFLGVLVTVHELGHFLAAKWAGVKVLKFSIGFGPKIVGFTRGETEYQVAWIPLGGFVRMAGELPGDEDEVAPEDRKRSFNAAPWWKRAIIVAAGPAFNLIFPIIAYFFAFLGDHQAIAARVGWVEPELPAAHAGLLPGDLVTAVDGKTITQFDEIRGTLDGVFDREVPITVQRDGQSLTLRITPMKTTETNPIEKVQRGLLGISSVARPAIVGVAPGSVAEVAGLKTFDRILTLNGEPVRDELVLNALTAQHQGPFTLVVARSSLTDVGGAGLVVPDTATVTVEKQPGVGFAALGAESGDLYAWTVFPGTPAEKAGLKRGDRLVAFDGKPLASYLTFQLKLRAAEKRAFGLTWRSGTEDRTAQVTSGTETEEDALKNRLEVMEFGVRPRLAFQGASEVLAAGPESEIITIHMGPWDALRASARTVPEAIRQIAIVMKKLFTRDIPLDAVGGPILLFQVASKSAEAGYDVFLKNMALVSVNLGLVNLLPIPVLDGFGLLAALWEGIRRRPIPMKAREVANYIGLAMLAMLVVLVFKNDITRLLR